MFALSRVLLVLLVLLVARGGVTHGCGSAARRVAVDAAAARFLRLAARFLRRAAS